jgi:hypothetical protein
MTDSPTLHDLNQHLYAQLLPDTHKVPDAAPAPKGRGGKKAAAANGAYTAEQLEVLNAAGIDDPAAADPQTVAAILGL